MLGIQHQVLAQQLMGIKGLHRVNCLPSEHSGFWIPEQIRKMTLESVKSAAYLHQLPPKHLQIFDIPALTPIISQHRTERSTTQVWRPLVIPTTTKARDGRT